MSVRQRLEQHRSVATCASCHAKIDPLGLALENYDAVGAWRERQNGEGRKGTDKDPPINASGVMPDGKEFQDLAGFKRVLIEEKEKFRKGFTEKLLAYALGRSLQLSDEALVESMEAQLAANDYRFGSLFETIVTSPQFLNRRVLEAHETAPPGQPSRKAN